MSMNTRVNVDVYFLPDVRVMAMCNHFGTQTFNIDMLQDWFNSHRNHFNYKFNRSEEESHVRPDLVRQAVANPPIPKYMKNTFSRIRWQLNEPGSVFGVSIWTNNEEIALIYFSTQTHHFREEFIVQVRDAMKSDITEPRKVQPAVTQIPFRAYRGTDPYVFVSYSHKDKQLVYHEIKRLNNEGYRIWYDEGIPPASRWRTEIAKAIKNCAFFLVFLSPRAVQSKYVNKEIDYAEQQDKRILPIYIEQTHLSDKLEWQLGSYQVIKKFQLDAQTYYDKLIEALPNTIKRSE
ncbi:MAG: toll/interleukin-1 receptor domain-containing protein [Candidatus Hermodarchaeota archaeon]